MKILMTNRHVCLSIICVCMMLKANLASVDDLENFSNKLSVLPRKKDKKVFFSFCRLFRVKFGACDKFTRFVVIG